MNNEILKGGAIEKFHGPTPFGPIDAEDVVVRLAASVQFDENYSNNPFAKAIITGAVILVGDKESDPESPDYMYYPEFKPWFSKVLGSRLGFKIFEFLVKKTWEEDPEEIDYFLNGMREAANLSKRTRNDTRGVSIYEGSRLDGNQVLISSR